MEIDSGGRFLYLAGRGCGEAGDVFSDGAVEHFDALGQVTDVGAEFEFVPGVDVGAVEADFAAGCWPKANEQTGKCGFA